MKKIYIGKMSSQLHFRFERCGNFRWELSHTEDDKNF